MPGVEYKPYGLSLSTRCPKTSEEVGEKVRQLLDNFPGAMGISIRFREHRVLTLTTAVGEDCDEAQVVETFEKVMGKKACL